MNYFKLLLCTLFTLPVASFAMEQAPYLAGQSPLELLPPELNARILKEALGRNPLSLEQAAQSEDTRITPEQGALRNARSFTSVSRSLRAFESDASIYKTLATNHFNGDTFKAAMAVGTQGATAWLKSDFYYEPNKMADSKYAKVRQELLRLSSVPNGNLKTKNILFLLKTFPQFIDHSIFYKTAICDVDPNITGIPDVGYFNRHKNLDGIIRSEDFFHYGDTLLHRIALSPRSIFTQGGRFSNALRCPCQGMPETEFLDAIIQIESEQRKTLDKSQSARIPRIIDRPNQSGITPLMKAIMSRFSSVTHSSVMVDGLPIDFSDEGRFIMRLLSHNPTMYAQDNKGQTVLHKLAYSINPPESFTGLSEERKNSWFSMRREIFNEIIKRDTEKRLINQKDNSGNTALKLALELKKYNTHDRSFIELLEQLLENGANPREKNKEGENFINKLVKESPWFLQSRSLVRMLNNICPTLLPQLINEPDNNGNTPLLNLIAPVQEHVGLPRFERCEILLEFGANPHIKDRIGRTVLETVCDIIRYNTHSLDRPEADKWRKFLWQHSPSKLGLYKKLHPYRFYSAIAGSVVGASIAGYLGLKLASKYMPEKTLTETAQ